MRKLAIALAALLLTATAATAQNDKSEKKPIDRTEMLKKRTEFTVKRYGLDEKQAARLLELNTKFADKMGPRAFGMGRGGRRGPGMGPRPNGNAPLNMGQRPELTEEQKAKVGERRKEMEESMKAYSDSLKSIMTEEQYQKYTEDMKRGQNGKMPRRPGRDKSSDRQAEQSQE